VSFGQISGFFLDSCVLLPQSSVSSRDACQKFLNENKECFISKSVKDELLQLSKMSCDAVVTCIRYYMRPALERKGLINITRNDATVVAEVLLQEKRRIAKEYPIRSGVRSELFGVIENYVADLIHGLDVNQSVLMDDLLANVLGVLNKARYDIEKPFKTIRVIPVDVDEELLTFVPMRKLVNKNPKDVGHLMSAVMYQFQRNAWVIFVTNDDKDILINAEDIWRNYGLRCTKPVWALDYRREITRFKQPRQHFQELNIPSVELRQFIVTVEKKLGIKIRPNVLE